MTRISILALLVSIAIGCHHTPEVPVPFRFSALYNGAIEHVVFLSDTVAIRRSVAHRDETRSYYTIGRYRYESPEVASFSGVHFDWKVPGHPRSIGMLTERRSLLIHSTEYDFDADRDNDRYSLISLESSEQFTASSLEALSTDSGVANLAAVALTPVALYYDDALIRRVIHPAIHFGHGGQHYYRIPQAATKPVEPTGVVGSPPP